MPSYPKLPFADPVTALMEADLEELWNSLLAEIADPVYSGRTHQNRRTHDAGCRGPLCRKAVREHARRRNRTEASERYRILDEILNAWSPVAREMVAEVQKQYLSQLMVEK